MKTDRELLELAARAAGLDVVMTQPFIGLQIRNGNLWRPLEDDGDAMRLALRLQFNIYLGYRGASVEDIFGKPLAEELCHKDSGREGECTRRAIVRAAAAIGESMK